MVSDRKFVIILVVLAALSCKVLSDEIEVAEDERWTIQCPADHGINIESATWNVKFCLMGHNFPDTYNRASKAILPKTRYETCNNDKTEIIKRICHGHNTCNLVPTKESLGCSETMFLRVYYSCEPCEPNREQRGVGDQVNVLDEGMLFVDGVCNWVKRLPGKNFNCPNDQFLRKHVCRDCDHTAFSVERFASQVANMSNKGATVSITFNSVFVALAMTYHQHGANCVFNYPVSKFHCHLIGDHWQCNRVGYNIASHNKETGHYDAELDT